MNTVTPFNKIIHTNKAECRDCYRCVRVCPVKAIKMKDEQAYVEENNCILCGNCIKACPQNAKSYRNDLPKVKELLANNKFVIASIAPSFAAYYNPQKISTALKKLGFSYVSETSNGVNEVIEKTFNNFQEMDKSQICSSCPALVNYVEKYKHSQIGNLVEYASPMLIHADKLKAKFNEGTKVVFIGPCIAKKAEAERPEYKNFVDAVLTFDELNNWLDDHNITLDDLDESDFDEGSRNKSRLFPLDGGLFKASSANMNLEQEVINTTGFENTHSALEYLETANSKVLLDSLMCEHGCINGPGISNGSNIFHNQNKLISYSQNNSTPILEEEKCIPEFDTKFKAKSIDGQKEISEHDIKKILSKTGKISKEDELNCSACGYETCREKAIAVLNGMAEVDMCIPYMRKLAEQRTDKIMETTPNGIAVLDSQLNILHINKSFMRLFGCSKSVLGKKISTIIDPEGFIKLETDKLDKLEETVEHKKQNKICHQIFYKIPNENQFVGIFVDITKNIKDKKKLQTLKAHTILQAQELLDHQIKMSQKMAKLLGESTAQSELLVENLIKITDDDNSDKKQNNKNWLWDIYTSK